MRDRRVRKDMDELPIDVASWAMCWEEFLDGHGHSGLSARLDERDGKFYTVGSGETEPGCHVLMADFECNWGWIPPGQLPRQLQARRS